MYSLSKKKKKKIPPPERRGIHTHSFRRPLSAATSAHHETGTPPGRGYRGLCRGVEPSTRKRRSSGRPPLLLLVQ